ncbi:protein hinderin-like [Ylistrum balloti]|uniref:protein hinderin-like n=1 Tax=Ylistrum balloti TaxID=509963 RepID=UPI0029059802|nr:protein hinderin-like [Ylistrum balloti]
MAEVVMPGRRAYWSKYALDSSEESESAFVPGVSAPGNRRPMKMLARKTPEIKVRIPVAQPLVEQLAVSMDTVTDISCDDAINKKQRPPQIRSTSGVKVMTGVNVKDTQRIKPGIHDNKQKSVSLKDLPLEEKKRIANLIKELARVGDEKEKAIDQLHTERNQFEKQVLQLVDQQERILNEREVIQNQLFQCQDLLARYQDKIEQKQQEVIDLITTPIKSQKEKQPRSRSRSPESSIPYTSHCHGNHADLRSSQDKLYTSLIDKAIANQRSGMGEDGLSSIGGQSEVGEGSVKALTPPRGHHPSLVPLALREPVMSSTQKSADIKVFNSEEGSFHSLQPDPSPRSSRISNEFVLANENKDMLQKSKVGFKEKLEEDFDKLHSPTVNPPGVFGDKSYMSYYKKLSQTDRKRELLRQREKLLDEQQRLKDILRSQEAQIKTRQNLIEQQRDLQQDRMEFFEKNGKFPLGRETAVPEGGNPTTNTSISSKENIPPPPVSLPLPQGQAQGDDDGSLFNYGVKKLNFDLEGEDVGEECTKTPPKSQQRNQQSMATSPIRMVSPRERATSSPYRGVDAATSVSHIHLSPRTQKHNESVEDLLLGQQVNLPLPHSPTIRSSTGQYQNNLPLQSNRGRSNQSPVSKPSAGDKTLSVIEILNTMEKSPSLSGSVRGNKNSPGLSGSVHGNRNSPGWSGGVHRDKDGPSRSGGSRGQVQSPRHGYITPQKSDSLYDFVEAEEEESQILEDVFFLK